MYNTDNKHFINTLICDTVKKGITDPKEIVEHIAGTYTITGKEIIRDEQNNTNGRRDDQSPNTR
jgi:hypothetical protein